MEKAHKKSLLVVEDEPDLLELLCEEIRTLPYNVFPSSTVGDALTVLKTEPIVAILSDISMPGATGIDFLEEVRKLGKNTPFLFLTAFDTKDGIFQALRLETVDFLEKPFDQIKLREKVGRAIELGLQQELETIPPESLQEQLRVIRSVKLQMQKK
jgi:DNA-binding NtrC family response regulator